MKPKKGTKVVSHEAHEPHEDHEDRLVKASGGCVDGCLCGLVAQPQRTQRHRDVMVKASGGYATMFYE